MIATMYKKFSGRNAAMLGGVLAGALLAAPAAAQMTSTAALKLACETGSGNVVNLNVNTQISAGPRPPLAELVDTPCTIVLGPQVTFEAGQVGMNFNGALTIQGGNESRALFISSAFVAASVDMNLTQSKGSVLVDTSLLQATAGDVTINTGAEGFVDVRGPLAGGNVLATGNINLSGGDKFIGLLANAELQAGGSVSMNMSGAESNLSSTASSVTAGGAVSMSGGSKFVSHIADTQLLAGTGLSVTMNGDEAAFVADVSTLQTTSGAVSINGTGSKGFVELKLGSVATGSTGVAITLTGNESTLNANQFALDGGTGDVTLRADGTLGKVTLDVGTINAGGAVTVQASATSTLGVTMMQDALITAGGDIRIESGNLGVTEAKDNSLTSPLSLVRIASGAGGVCTSLNNIISAPTQQICP